MSLIPSSLAPVHRDAHATMLICVLVFLAGLLLWWPIALLGLIAVVAVYLTYRDPERVVPQRAGLVVSPADGRVIHVGDDPPPAELEMGAQACAHIAIAIEIWDSHVNRMPVDGVVELISYRPGLFLSSTLDRASEYNERQALRVQTAAHGPVGIMQIAGILARRIVANVKEGDCVITGERFGLIRFGSRVDVFLPPGVTVLVEKGQRMVGGETVIADFNGTEGRRSGVVR